MSEKKEFLKHTFIYGIGGILSQLAPFILFPLYTNYLPPDDYGIIDIIDRTAWLINIVLVVSGIRLATFTFYKQAATEDEKRKVAVTLSVFLWIAVAFAILFAHIFAIPLDYFLKTNNSSLLAFGLMTSLMDSLVAIPLALMQARLESLRFVLTNMAMLLFRICLCVSLVAWGELGIWGVLIANYITASLFAIMLTIRELHIGSFTPDFSKIKEVWAFCWPFIPGGLLMFVYSNMDRYFILEFSNFHTEDAALVAYGLYAVGTRLRSIIPLFGASPLRQVWFAKMYNVYKQPDASIVFGEFAIRICVVFSLGSLALCIFAKDLVVAVCNPSYFGAVPLIAPLVVAVWFENIALQMESTYYITRTTRYKMWVSAAMLPVTLLFLWIFVPRWNVIGAAYASICSSCVSCVINYCVTQRIFRIRYYYAKYVILFGVSAACYFLSLAVGDGISPSALSVEQMAEMTKWERIQDIFGRVNYFLILAKAAILLPWMAGIWVTGVISESDKSTIRLSVRKAYEFALKMSPIGK